MIPSTTTDSVERRAHIQDHASAKSLEPHWGYAERVVPCTNDAGSCEYLDVVYGAHDVGMIYVGVIWLTLVAILVAWGVLRLWRHLDKEKDKEKDNDNDNEGGGGARAGGVGRAGRAVAVACRRRLLPESMRTVFGRTTRYQISVLALLAAYLAIWTFVGITYKRWITPVKNTPGLYNTRTSLGPVSDRLGVLAYALTPLSILLASRESVLTIITGLPYQSFNFLHRWLGYVMLVQASVHTIGWSIIELRLYQPQPTVGIEWITQTYMIWGIVAMGLLLLMWFLTLPFVVRATGHEFFRKAHYVLAGVYMGACIAHWEALSCFLIPSLLLWGIDRFVRALRTVLIHRNAIGGGDGRLFNPASAKVTLFPNQDDGDIVRLDFKHPHRPWKVGEHFYLCFTEGSIWQSHPFTPVSYPETVDGAVAHSYVFRAKSGETKKIAQLAAAKGALDRDMNSNVTTPVILTGPYGGNIMGGLAPSANVLCVAGGTGIAYVFPVLFALDRETRQQTRKVELVWVVRRQGDIEWVRRELDGLRTSENISVRVYVTRESVPSGSVSDEKVTSDPRVSGMVRHASTFSVVGIESDGTKHPHVGHIVDTFMSETVRGRTTVYASGPGPMMTDLRAAVAACNDGGRVWRGEDRFDVELRCDDRLER